MSGPMRRPTVDGQRLYLVKLQAPRLLGLSALKF